MPDRTESGQDGGVKVIHKAVRILEAFTPEQPTLSLGALAKATGCHPTTVRRILLTLEELNLVAQDPVSREYAPGMKLFELGSRVTYVLAIRRAARPIMAGLTEQSGESTYLGVFDAGDVVYTEIVESSHPLRIAVRVGERSPAHCTGTGKVLLAYLPPEQQRAFLEKPLQRYTPQTPATAADLLTQLRAVKQAGYGVSCEEQYVGISSVAVPVWDRTGKVVAGLSLCGPSSRLPEEELHRLAPSLITAAKKISHALGGPGSATI